MTKIPILVTMKIPILVTMMTIPPLFQCVRGHHVYASEEDKGTSQPSVIDYYKGDGLKNKTKKYGSLCNDVVNLINKVINTLLTIIAQNGHKPDRVH